MNLLNYFTTIDTTARQHRSLRPERDPGLPRRRQRAELNRQRSERAAISALNADVVRPRGAREHAGGGSPTGATASRRPPVYDFVNTGGIGTDAIRVRIIYRSSTVEPVGGHAILDSSVDPRFDSTHSRPPVAQTFDVMATGAPVHGGRSTTSSRKGVWPAARGPADDADAGDGQRLASTATRPAQANRLLTDWINGTVCRPPATPTCWCSATSTPTPRRIRSDSPRDSAAVYTNLARRSLGADAYSYLFDGQLGHLDYALSSASLTPQVTGVGAWHINADEVPLFDYNDEVRDARRGRLRGEAGRASAD